MRLGLCLCQGAGQCVSMVCGGVGCECSSASPLLCRRVPSSIQKHWKTAQPLWKYSQQCCTTVPALAVLLVPTGTPHVSQPQAGAAIGAPQASPCGTEPMPTATALSRGLRWLWPRSQPSEGPQTQRMSTCPVKLQAGAGSCDAVHGCKAKMQAGSYT